METVAVRLKNEERRTLEAVAEQLSALTGSSVSLTDAFAHLLRHLPADVVAQPGGVATGALAGVFAMNLDNDQVAALDDLAQKLANRKAAIMGGEATPVRSDAIRFVIRSGAAIFGKVA